MSPAADMREFRGSEWFARQLGIRFEGVTSTACRRAKIREAMIAQRREDLAAHFERLFGVPYHVTETAYAPQEPSL